ncbi:MAG: hypothetical protein P9L99_03415 [Candidatus Lernaella stagnicola]|nr:hypothetical protein [Candidatus Lernaella stagnicola]
MKLKWLLTICAVFLVIFPGLALGAEKIAILDLINKSGLPENDVYFLTELIRGQVKRSLPSSSYSIMTRENIFELLSPDMDLKKCTEAECEVQVGRQLGAAYIITGDALIFDRRLHLMKNFLGEPVG